jgi:hypothetical protein
MARYEFKIEWNEPSDGFLIIGRLEHRRRPGP